MGQPVVAVTDGLGEDGEGLASWFRAGQAHGGYFYANVGRPSG